jgi:hypothetical protein
VCGGRTLSGPEFKPYIYILLFYKPSAAFRSIYIPFLEELTTLYNASQPLKAVLEAKQPQESFIQGFQPWTTLFKEKRPAGRSTMKGLVPQFHEKRQNLIKY